MRLILTLFIILNTSYHLYAQDSFVAWSKQLFKITTVPTVCSDGKIFSSSSYGTITCLINPGNVGWELETNGTINSSPVSEKDLLVAATNEGDLLTINTNTGDLIQAIGTGEYITSGIAVIDVVQNGTTTKAVVAGTAEGNFYCYDLEKLELLWTNQSSKSKINSSVVFSNNKVFFQDEEGTLYCVSSNNGLLIWEWKPNIKNADPLFKSDLFLQNDNLYLVDQNENFHCINILMGTEKWNVKKIGASGIIRTNGKKELILSTTKSKIITVSTKLGKVIDEINLPITDEVSITDILVIENSIIAGFTNGTVYKIKPKTEPEIIHTSTAPIISLTNVGGECLVTDYDGNLTLLKLSE